MIIVNLTGGLGNQMFQYAFGKYLSIKHKAELKFHFTNALFNTKRTYELDVFKINEKFATKKDLEKLGIINNEKINRILYLIDERFHINFNKNITTERMPRDFKKTYLNIKDNSYLQGFWNNERYFKEIENVLRKDFVFKAKLDKKNLEILEKINKTNSVSIHVRRTDFITKTNNNFVGLNYYKKSIKQIEAKVKNPTYFIFSDDILWCKENLKTKNKIYFIENNIGKNSYKDMQLMSNCKHNIIANSTFSWWGSWLNNNKNKILIKPKN